MDSISPEVREDIRQCLLQITINARTSYISSQAYERTRNELALKRAVKNVQKRFCIWPVRDSLTGRLIWGRYYSLSQRSQLFKSAPDSICFLVDDLGALNVFYWKRFPTEHQLIETIELPCSPDGEEQRSRRLAMYDAKIDRLSAEDWQPSDATSVDAIHEDYC
jgi:hypothetical protein